MSARAARILLVGFVGCFLIASCSIPKQVEREARPADIDEVRIGSPQTPPPRVRVTAYGFLTNGCERLGEVTQRLEGRTFFIEITKREQPEGAECHTAITEFEKETLLEVGGFADGVYTVDVNEVTETFELKGGGVFVESGRASLTTVDAQVLAASPGTAAAKVGVFVEGEFGDPCVDLRGVKQVREGNMFRLTLDATERIDVACPPVGEFFWEFTLLAAQTLSSGTYQVEVVASNTLTTSFELRLNATYQKAKVTEVEVMPTESFTANVLVRGELRSSCEVIDGAVQQQEGTDRDMLADDNFIISLITRTEGTSCDDVSTPFKEIIPISSYGSGDYTVDVNGVVESFTLPGAEPFTRP